MAGSAPANAKSSSSPGVRHRRDRRSRRLGKGDGARLAVAAAAGALAGWWVVKTSAVDGFRSAPAAAHAVAPGHPAPRLAMAADGIELSMGRVDPARQQAAAEALADAPLSAEPFLLAGLAAATSGREAQGQALLEEARRRNPRLRDARLFLLQRYLVQGKVDEAGGELAALRRLEPRVVEALAPQLAAMVRDERVSAQLIRVLSRDPAVQQAVLGRLATTGADPDLILRVARGSPTPATPDGLPWQRILLVSLVQRGEMARALQLWRDFSGLPAGPTDKAVHDGRFQGLPGAVPFNWAITSSSAGVAERIPAPALQVEYYGRESTDLAQQLMVLRPGRYRLEFRAEGNAKGDDSRLAWRIMCQGSATPIAEVVLRDISAAPKVIRGEFTVPAGCAAQSLRLSGIAGEFPGIQLASITDVRIVPAGGR